MERDLIRSQTLDLLEAGLVELSHGEYASATVTPAKKDVHGNYTDRRMCEDYHPINRRLSLISMPCLHLRIFLMLWDMRGFSVHLIFGRVPSIANSRGRQGQDCILGRQLSRQGLFVSVEVLTFWVEECTCRVSMCDG
jgi:hypothetical protein